MAIELLLEKYCLSISQLHGQGYDGARNMHGVFSGLKDLIMKENCSIYYFDYFAS